MYAQKARVASEIGLHARPAATVARAAQGFSDPVYLSLRGETVEAKSGLMIMTLGAACGDVVTVESTSEDAVRRVVELIETTISPL
ncbi:MAG: HPr family phosphocarrier protein [Actinomycetaceae bacterium]|nr:HPr family phosphocarrier protein [Actinomycetaceae bacterium]